MTDATQVRRPLAACTIISRNYLAHAKVLARSFREHEPDGRFYLLVVDRLPTGETLDADLAVRVVDPGELGLAHYDELCFKYDVIELNTAVKPAFLSLLLSAYGEREVVYLDPDILIARPLEELRAALDSADLVLTPHILSPLPLDGRHPDDQDILISGTFNLGFVALRASAQTERLLRWWGERLDDHCRVDIGRGLFTDQRWMDLAPSLFPSLHVLRDASYNVAFWNLHERTLTREARGRFLVEGRPLGFYHFSGFDPHKPLTLSKHQDRTTVAVGTPLAELLRTYADRLLEEGFDVSRKWGYGFDVFDDGRPVSWVLRRMYLGLTREQRSRFGNPFRASGNDETFLSWATRPRAADGNLSRLLRAVYTLRADVAAAFPDVAGEDRARFMEWARTQGPRELGYDASMVCDAQESGAPVSIYDVIRPAVNRDQKMLVFGEPASVTERFAGDFDVSAFPCLNGEPAPADAAEAVDRLENLRERGAAFLLLPHEALGECEQLPELKEHLQKLYDEVALRREDVCVLFDLRRRKDNAGGEKQESYEALVRRVRHVARTHLSSDARVAVISRGDEQLLKLGGRTAWHLPQNAHGVYAGYNPADGADAVAQLESLRRGGAQFLLLPSTAFWWLEYYKPLAEHLQRVARQVWADESCILYRLAPAEQAEAAPT